MTIQHRCSGNAYRGSLTKAIGISPQQDESPVDIPEALSPFAIPATNRCLVFSNRVNYLS